jgi:uncharacterized protein YukE
MSRQAIADPEELERFASELKRFNQELSVSTSRLHASFRRVGETWRDQEYRKYANEFEETVRVLSRFMETTDKQIPFLQHKARLLREYLRHGR